MKKNFKFLLIIAMMIIIVFTAITVVACKNDNNNPGNTDEPGQVDYTITVKRNSGQPFAGANVLLYPKDGSRPFFATADSEGKAVINAPKADYTVKFTNIVEGYKQDDNYTISANETTKEFLLSAELIMTPATKDTSYVLGSVMHDFSFTDVYGQDYSLSELLMTKKAVLLNFWYTDCYWCGYEFPAMVRAYSDFSEDIAVIAFNTKPADTKDAVIQYASDNNLPFIIVDASEPTSGSLFHSFGFDANPASVVIDKQGVVCFSNMGAEDEAMFAELFRRYSADPYKPFIYFPNEQTNEKPDVEKPSVEDVANTVNADGMNATYSFIDDELNWPWVIDGDSIKTSNAGHHNSYATIDAKLQASNTQCIAFDYKLLTEANNDLFLVYVDNVLIHTLSGNVSDWTTCYAYVPLKESGEYEITFAYTKDSSKNPDGDYVAVKNLRYVPIDSIDTRTEIIYRAASGANLGNKYSDYITPVYNETDGYYHVGDANGPLLLADLMNPDTAWSNSSAWSYVETADLKYDLDGDGIEEDYTNSFTIFAQMANSSPRMGYLGVTEEVKTNLMALTAKHSNKHENEWLELCSYVIVYGPNAEVLGDPAIGLGFHNAFDAKVSESTDNQALNTVVKTRVIMPRGIYFRFVPSETAIYKINSIGTFDTICFVYDADRRLLAESDDDTDPNTPFEQAGNFVIKALFEKDTEYYISLDFNFVEDIGQFDFVINKLATSGNVWVHASGANYETVLDDEGNITDVVVANAVDYALGEDGVYHVKNEDGTLGSKIYIDLLNFTYLFPYNSIADGLNMTCYYCKSCGYKYYGSVEYFEEQENPYCTICLKAGKANFEKINTYDLPTPIREENGQVRVVSFEQTDENGNVTVVYVPLYELYTSTNIDYTDPNEYLKNLETYKIKFTDYSERLAHYIELSQTEGHYPALEEAEGPASHKGLVEATEELVDILNKFIVFGDYSISPSINNAWLMMSYYYMYLG